MATKRISSTKPLFSPGRLSVEDAAPCPCPCPCPAAFIISAPPRCLSLCIFVPPILLSSLLIILLFLCLSSSPTSSTKTQRREDEEDKDEEWKEARDTGRWLLLLSRRKGEVRADMDAEATVVNITFLFKV